MAETPTDLNIRAIDLPTGLPRLAAALSDLPALMRDTLPGHSLGLISLAVVPDAALYRHSAESVNRMRIEGSREIESLLREQDLLYVVDLREWLILLPNLLSASALTLAMIRLRDSLSASSHALHHLGQCPRLALGSAHWPGDGCDPLFLVQSARIARLFSESGDSQIHAYDPSMDVASSDAQALLDELRSALLHDDALALHLQPQVKVNTGQCSGAEILLRWQRKSGEWIEPPQVLEAIDRLGLRQTFNRWLFHRSAQIQEQLAKQGIDIALSINLSANDLLDIELPDMIGQALAVRDIAPEKIILEITETMMVEESRQVMEVIGHLRKLGLRLAIDDFGTGYAGMGYLQRLPVQEVKIDQMFVRQAADSHKAREIITSVIQLANRLGLNVVAEGVESAKTLGVLSSLGCRFAQGFLFSKALSPPDFIQWWQHQQCDVSATTDAAPLAKKGNFSG